MQILDWFRCIDYVEATGDKKAVKWMTEMARRDNLVFKLLGVPL